MRRIVWQVLLLIGLGFVLGLEASAEQWGNAVVSGLFLILSFGGLIMELQDLRDKHE